MQPTTGSKLHIDWLPEADFKSAKQLFLQGRFRLSSASLTPCDIQPVQAKQLENEPLGPKT